MPRLSVIVFTCSLLVGWIFALAETTSAADPATAAREPAQRSAPAWALCRKPAKAPEQETFANVPDGDIFGFTNPTDVGEPGDCGVDFEFSGQAGKGGGSSRAVTLKTEFSTTIAENLSIALSPIATYHRIRNVTGLDDLSRVQFAGLSGELRYRFIERSASNALAATFAVEPQWVRVGSGSSPGVTQYSIETKLALDAVLIPGRLYGAVNLNYAPAVQNTDGVGTWVGSSELNISGALTYQLGERLFLGAEVRHLADFEGEFLNRIVGSAVLAGPTLLVRLTDAASLNLAWTPQLLGRVPGSGRRLDLDNFTHQEFRVKLSMSH